MTLPLDLDRATANPPRLQLGDGGSATLLDGGWWPHSIDPDAELPDLIAAIDHLYTPVRRLVLSADGWETHPRTLRIGTRTIRIGYFASQPVALLTAICEGGDRVDLLVVPPSTAAQTAAAAMAIAANRTNTVHAQQILTTAAADPAPVPARAA
jgi:hypothetical protein